MYLQSILDFCLVCAYMLICIHPRRLVDPQHPYRDEVQSFGRAKKMCLSETDTAACWFFPMAMRDVKETRYQVSSILSSVRKMTLKVRIFSGTSERIVETEFSQQAFWVKQQFVCPVPFGLSSRPEELCIEVLPDPLTNLSRRSLGHTASKREHNDHLHKCKER